MDQLATPNPAPTRTEHAARLVDAIDLPMARWDRDARLVYCNQPYLRWAGKPRDALLGRTLTQLYGGDAWSAACNAFAAALAGRAATYERQLTHRATGSRWARVAVFPERDTGGDVEAVCSVAFDIDDDVLERQRLEATRRRLDRFTDNIPYPLTYVDAGCVLRFVNRAYVTATGQAPERLIGRHIGEVRGAQRWAEHKPYFDRALAGEPVQYTRLTDLADGGPRWMRTSYVPDFDDGRVVGLYTVTIDVHELTVTQARLKRSAERDALTDCFSRRAMMDRIDAALLPGAEQPMALFFVDLDGFKDVNDRLGHAAGDRLLRAVVHGLQQAVRGADSVGRFGGDEFLVLAPVRDAAGAHVLAHHLLQAVRDCGSLTENTVSASIGYALAPGDAAQPLRLLQLADDAMYAAKRAGKNRVVHAAPAAPARG